MLWLFAFFYMEVIVFVCITFHVTANGVVWLSLCRTTKYYGSQVFKKQNALILHIKAWCRMVHPEFCYNPDAFLEAVHHAILTKKSNSCLKLQKLRDLFICRHAATFLYIEIVAYPHCNPMQDFFFFVFSPNQCQLTSHEAISWSASCKQSLMCKISGITF